MNPTLQPESFADVQAPVLTADPPQVTTMLQVREELPLMVLPDPKKVVKADPKKVVNPQADALADQWLNQLLDVKTGDLKAARASNEAVTSLGSSESREMVRMNNLLDQPLNRLAEVGTEGGQMATDLAKLKVQFDKLDPAQIKFDRGFFGFLISLFSWLPFVGTPLNVYFTRFRSGGNTINDIFKSLEVGKETLLRDVEVLKDDQLAMRNLTTRVQKLIEVGHLVAQKLQARVDGESNEERKRFMKEELQFPLLQRLTDLQQQVIVNQQGVITFEVLVRNNLELVRGVDRCWTVTLPALRIGVMAAMALANQRIVLKGIQALNAAAEGFLTFNSKLLASQGTEIQKAASTSQLKESVLAAAVATAVKALDDVSNFRVQAVAQMQSAVTERQKSIDQAEASILKMEKGNRARPTITLELPEEKMAA